MYSPGAWVDEQQRYRLQHRLGGGGMGEVFLATDMRLGKPVALKLLKDSLAMDEDIKRRFERELSICAALKSQHIVQVNDYGLTKDGHPFYTMEYLQGQTLGQLLRQEHQLSVHQVYLIMSQICAGLQLAHDGVMLWNEQKKIHDRIKVVHRDLKPDNIFLVPTALGNLVKIIDFGIAKIRSFQIEQTSLTHMFLGTFHYAAPEQLEVATSLDERADIYSLGVILYEMLAGIDPFGFDFRHNQVSSQSWLVAHASKQPIPIRSQSNCDHISPELESVVMQCLAKSPKARFESVTALSQALQAAVSNSETAAGILKGSQSAQSANQSTNQSANPIAIAPTYYPEASPDEVSPTAMSPSEVAAAIAETAAPAPVQPEQKTVPASRSSRWWVVGAGILTAVALAIGIYSLPQRNPSPTVVTQTGGTTNDQAQHSLAQTIEADAGSVWSLALNFDATLLYSSGDDQTIKAWDVNTGQLLQSLQGHTKPVVSVTLTPDQQTLVSSSFDRTVKLWDAKTGNLIRTLEGHTDSVWSAVVSPDGKTIASGSADRTVKLWDAKTGELIRTLEGHTDWVFHVAFSPDRQLLASASKDGTVKLWNAKTGELVKTLTGHTQPVRSIAFDPTGEKLISASWDKTLKLWDVKAGTEIQTYTGHTDRVVSVVFLPDGQRFASASIDGTIRLWQVDQTAPIETIAAHPDWVLSVASTSSGNMLVSSSRDHTIKIWKQ